MWVIKLKSFFFFFTYMASTIAAIKRCFNLSDKKVHFALLSTLDIPEFQEIKQNETLMISLEKLIRIIL